MKRIFSLLALVLIVLPLVSACSATQETVQERNSKLGERSAASNFFEAQQISKVEDWKDIPGKIVNVYIINPVTGGLLVPPVQCMGVPNSSTESLEPNSGRDSGSRMWRVPIDGVDALTEEMAGKDGTFGDPVHFRYCMTTDGHYFDFPAYGIQYIVSSAFYTFPDATVKRDYETEAKLLVAEQILKRGGCINPETLVEIPCKPKP